MQLIVVLVMVPLLAVVISTFAINQIRKMEVIQILAILTKMIITLLTSRILGKGS